ncbi:MAG: hypothetical protein ACKO7W_08295 [Elainella sp.]
MLDFEDYSLIQPAVLVTILTESALQASLEKLLKNLKVYGYSVQNSSGAVKRVRLFGQPQAAEAAATEVENYDSANVEIRAVVSPELSNVILFALKEQQRQFPILVYRQKVEALIE